MRTAYQKLLFSATLSQDPEKLSPLQLFQPKLFTTVVTTDASAREGEFLGKYTTPAELSEMLLTCEVDVKPLVLHHILTSHHWKGVLVFCNSWEGTHRLAVLLDALGGGITVCEFSAKLSVKERQNVLKQFKRGHIHVVISTDSMA